MHQKLSQLKDKIQMSIESLRNGGMLLIADDGKRENEVDLVFHARHANAENINFALSHAKGLLCVSIGQTLADRLGFYTAPRFPGGISHTNFTLSVDAAQNISSGISAQDRAHTIALMSDPNASVSDFTTPGHVFPVRALDGGLLKRAGHTEASADLCLLADLPPVAVMCEVLGHNGEPLRPMEIGSSELFKGIPFVTTPEILWYRVFFDPCFDCFFKEIDPLHYVLQPGSHAPLTIATGIKCYHPQFSPETLRISMTDGFSFWDNGVSLSSACAEISLFHPHGLQNELPKNIEEFTDLSAKEGLQNTCISVRRAVSLYKALQFLEKKYEGSLLGKQNILKISFPIPGDVSLFF